MGIHRKVLEPGEPLVDDTELLVFELYHERFGNDIHQESSHEPSKLRAMKVFGIKALLGNSFPPWTISKLAFQ